MSTTLEILDGDPYWWDSPDIWVVPGSDPNGSPGQPIAGEPAFLWARVHNTGKQTALDARVNFYWSNPATGVLRSNSTLIGSAFADLAPGETKEVLCVIPWIPLIVNEGHECIVSEVIHPSDPLPIPLPDEFNPPAYHQIAQKNLSILVMKKSMITMTIQTAAPPRKEKILLMTTKIGRNLDKQNIIQLGLKNYRPAKSDSLKAGFSLDPGCDESGKEQLKKEVKIQLRRGTIKAIYLKVWPPELKARTYILLHVIARDEQKKVLGGITYILIKTKEE
jgi:hypothetical protein